MENNKTIGLAEKIKAIAITFIGAGIFSQGTFYFKEQSSYNIPRILYPVFELLGNKGLAVAMLILGLGLVYWGYSKWKKQDGKIGVFALIAVVSFATFFAILFFTGTKKTTTEELIKKSDETRAKGIEKMKEMDEPDLGNEEVRQHFANFEMLLQERKKAFNEKNQEAIKASDEAYRSWAVQSAPLIQKLTTPKEKQDFALYLGKLSMKWSDIK